MIRKNRIAWILVVSLLASLSPVSLSSWRVFSQDLGLYTVISGNQEWTEDTLIDGGTVVVNQGATLTVKRGVTVTCNWCNITIRGTMIVDGTVKEPVIIKKDPQKMNYNINVESTGKLIMKNADVSGAGAGWSSVYNKSSVVNTAQAYLSGGINVKGGWLDVEGTAFHDNEVAVLLTNKNLDRIKVNRSKFINNNSYDVYYYGPNGNLANFKYNWWGGSDGPAKICYSVGNCWYEKFEGEVNFSEWAANENFRDPVVLVPGLLGSQKKDGKWEMDLILHVYDNLYNSLVANGYTPEKDLFTFPYEWRDSNVENAKILKEKIDYIKANSHWPKVDVVAHSMGGLMAREYIESDYYQNDVDQFITLGTPNLGSPESYLTWDGGEVVPGWMTTLFKLIFTHEAEENGFDTLFDYIHGRPITSLSEVLPTYSYLFDIDESTFPNLHVERIYPENYPRNLFLENLNLVSRKKKLDNIEYTKIIGMVGSENSTISGYNVVNSDSEELWSHGYPSGFKLPIGDRGLKRSDGDGTVPEYSGLSSEISADYTIELESDHKSLPTKGQVDIIETLTGKPPETEKHESLVKNILIISVYSPVDIQVINSSGKSVGKNIEAESEVGTIPGAYYSGSDAVAEFVTIPNPSDGEYKLIAQGTGEGEYRIEVAGIFEDENAPSGVWESVAVIRGLAHPESKSESSFELKNGKVVSDNLPPEIQIISPEAAKGYLNNQSLRVDYSVTDNVSTSSRIKIEVLYDGQPLQEKELDLSLQRAGEHFLLVSAVDEAGNKAEKSIQFSYTSSVSAIADNVNHYFNLGLIENTKTRDFLLVKLNELVHVEEMIAKLDEKDNENPRDNQIKLFIKKTEDLLDFIESKFDEQIHDPAKQVMTQSLNFVKTMAIEEGIE